MTVVVLVLSGCSMTTRGVPGPFIGASAGESRSGQSSPARPRELDCPVEAIRPAGGPFCYELPESFSDFSKELDYGQGWTYRSLVKISDQDLIMVLGQRFAVDLDTLSVGQRATYFQQQKFTGGRRGVVSATPLARTLVDGAEAYKQDVVYEVGVRAHQVTVIKGHAEISVSCQQVQDGYGDFVDRACAQVLKYIQIAGD